MTADVSLSQLYWNPKVANFFFRDQAYEAFEKFLKTGSEEEQKERIEKLENEFNDLDELKEFFYDNDYEDILSHFDITE